MKAAFILPIGVRARWLLAVAALLAGADATLFLGEPLRENEAASSRARVPVPTARPSEPAPVVAADSAPPERERDPVDLFAPRTWEPPPPVVAMPIAPAPPQAPPLPFKFFGRIVDAGQAPSFILTRGTEMITVKVGDRIEPAYRVDKFDGTQLHLLYLPLNIRQTIFVGNANE